MNEKTCGHEFKGDGSPCLHCGKTVSELAVDPGMIELFGELYKMRSSKDLVRSEEELLEENKKLRTLLWQEHPCEGKYGDDGELQCGACMIDFKRESVDAIENSLFQRSLLKYAEYQIAQKAKGFEDESCFHEFSTVGGPCTHCKKTAFEIVHGRSKEEIE